MIILKSFSFYIAIAGILLLIVFSQMIGKPALESQPAQNPSKSPFLYYLAASGIVESMDKNIEIGSPEDGIIEKLWVNVGDEVKKDDPLFKVDSRNLATQLAIQNANYEVAKITLEKQQNLFKRVQSVQNPRSISKEDFEMREDEVKLAEAKLIAAKAEISRIEQLLERLTVRAPKDGTILLENIRVGEFVARNNSAMILGDIRHLQMRVSIDEQNAGKFKKTAKAVAFPKNNTSIKIPLTFVRIEPYVIPKKSLTGVSEERVDTRVLQVIYSFEVPADYTIYVGQQTDVFIETQSETSTTKKAKDDQT